MKDCVPVWKIHIISTLEFPDIIVVKISVNVQMMVAIGNSSHMWKEKENKQKAMTL